MGKDGYGIPNWRDIKFSGLIDGYGQLFSPMIKGEKEMDKLTLKDKVATIVEDTCDDLGSFTSLDVSNKVKQHGFPSVRHREVAHIVRTLYVDGLMEDYGYERSLINVTLSNGQQTQAYVYHHQSQSPDSYDRRSQVAIPVAKSDDNKADDVTIIPSSAAAVTPASSPSIQVLNTGSSSDTLTRTRKGDCRLEIPASWVKELGWRSGSNIYIIHDSGMIMLKESDDVGTSDRVLMTTTVTDGRLRVPKTAFEKAGFSGAAGTSHEVILEDTFITVKDA